MAERDRTAERILEVAADNPQLSAREIARRVGCTRSRVTQVLRRVEDEEGLEAAVDTGGPTASRTTATGAPADMGAERDPELDDPGWLVPGVLATVGVGLVVALGGPEAPVWALLVGGGLLVAAVATAPVEWRG